MANWFERLIGNTSRKRQTERLKRISRTSEDYKRAQKRKARKKHNKTQH